MSGPMGRWRCGASAGVAVASPSKENADYKSNADNSYQGGNPWLFATLAAAELLYARSDKEAKVTDVLLPFPKDLDSNITAESYSQGSAAYFSLTGANRAIKAYTDGFISAVHPSNGSLARPW